MLPNTPRSLHSTSSSSSSSSSESSGSRAQFHPLGSLFLSHPSTAGGAVSLDIDAVSGTFLHIENRDACPFSPSILRYGTPSVVAALLPSLGHRRYGSWAIPTRNWKSGMSFCLCAKIIESSASFCSFLLKHWLLLVNFLVLLWFSDCCLLRCLMLGLQLFLRGLIFAFSVYCFVLLFRVAKQWLYHSGSSPFSLVQVYTILQLQFLFVSVIWFNHS